MPLSSSTISGGDRHHDAFSDSGTPRRSTRLSPRASSPPSPRPASTQSCKSGPNSARDAGSPTSTKAMETEEEYGEDYEEDFDEVATGGVSLQHGAPSDHQKQREHWEVSSPTSPDPPSPFRRPAPLGRSERREEEEEEEEDTGPRSLASKERSPDRAERRDASSDIEEEEEEEEEAAEEGSGQPGFGERRDADDNEEEEPQEGSVGQEEAPDSGAHERRAEGEEEDDDEEDFRRTGPRPVELRRMVEEEEATQRLLLQSQAYQSAVHLLDCAGHAEIELAGRLNVAALEQKVWKTLQQEAMAILEELEAREQAMKAALASTLNIERVKRGKLVAEENRCRTDLFHAAQEELKVLEEQAQKKASLRAIACKAVTRSEEKARQALAGQAAQALAALRKAAQEERFAIEESREALARKEVEEVRRKLEAMQAEAAEKDKRRRERESAERELVRQQREEEERRRREKDEQHAEAQRQRAEKHRAHKEAMEQKRQRREEELQLIREEQRKEEELQQQLERRARVLAMRAVRCQHEVEINRRGVQERQVLRQIHGVGRHGTRAEAWDQGSQASRQRSSSRTDSARKKDAPDPQAAGGHGNSWDQPSPPCNPETGKPPGLCTLPPLPCGAPRPPPPKPRLVKNKAAAALPYLPEIFGDQNPLLRPAPFRPVGPRL
eukprot:GGOE01058858.1.p1 GENE.GGOE01058858.1~~GGOE01058858.1.p1  ORF type:complete len:669 (-),score=217.83 GGOE01058858.1:557-2563(-)